MTGNLVGMMTALAMALAPAAYAADKEKSDKAPAKPEKKAAAKKPSSDRKEAKIVPVKAGGKPGKCCPPE